VEAMMLRKLTAFIYVFEIFEKGVAQDARKIYTQI
jgi:hypothetical protein